MGEVGVCREVRDGVVGVLELSEEMGWEEAPGVGGSYLNVPGAGLAQESTQSVGRRPPSPLPTRSWGERMSLAVAGGGSRHSGNQTPVRCRPQAHAFSLCALGQVSSLRVPSRVAVADSCCEAHTS